MAAKKKRREKVGKVYVVWPPDASKIVWRSREDGYVEGRFKHRGRWHVCALVHPEVIKRLDVRFPP